MFKMCTQQESLAQRGIIQARLLQVGSLQQGFRTIRGCQVSRSEHGVTSIGPAQVGATQIGPTEIGTPQLTTS
jgi:hypothetical protein